MVDVEVLTDVRMDAGGTFALMTKVEVLTVHGIDVGRRTAKVAQITLEVRQLGDGLDLLQNALLAARGDELALMGRDGAEGATAETAAMEADGELNHVVGRDALAFVFGMGKACVGKVEGAVEFVLCEGLIGWVDHSIHAIHFLDDALGSIFVRLLFDVAEIFGLRFFVAKALFVAVQKNVVGTDAARDFPLFQQGNRLFLWKSRHEIPEHLHTNLTILLHQKLCQ